MIHTTERFLETLPRTTVRLHIAQIHAISLLMWKQGRYDESMMGAVEYSLRNIAQYTAEPELRYGYAAAPPAPNWLKDGALDSAAINRAVRKAAESMRNALERMGANIRQSRIDLQHRRKTQESKMTDSEYIAKVAREQRRIGLGHVQAEVARARKELNLPVVAPLTRKAKP